jgi:hypothetical protein
MKINLKSGIAELLFGMKEKDVAALYGAPSRTYKDEDGNIIYLYNDKKLRLTFYADEDFRLGYLISSNPDLALKGNKILGQSWATLEPVLHQSGLKAFESEHFDSVENQFNEDNWIIFQVEFGEVIRVELGAIINAKDEFDWKFRS